MFSDTTSLFLLATFVIAFFVLIRMYLNVKENFQLLQKQYSKTIENWNRDREEWKRRQTSLTNKISKLTYRVRELASPKQGLKSMDRMAQNIIDRVKDEGIKLRKKTAVEDDRWTDISPLYPNKGKINLKPRIRITRNGKFPPVQGKHWSAPKIIENKIPGDLSAIESIELKATGTPIKITETENYDET